MSSLRKATLFAAMGLLVAGVAGCGQGSRNNGSSPAPQAGKPAPLPKRGTAIVKNQGNLQIQFSHLAGYSSQVVHQAYCKNGRYMVDVPSGRRVLDGSSIKKLCQSLASGSIPSGDQQCPKLSSKIPQIIIKGKLDGRDFSAKYSQGPCAKSFVAWNKLVATWQGPVKEYLPPYTLQKIMLLLPRPNQQKPHFLMAPSDDPEWQSRYRGAPPCEVSMPRDPYHVCVVKIRGQASALITLNMTAAQTEALIGASPSKVFQVIRSAQVVPVPPGYPGYVPRKPGVLPNGGFPQP